MFQYDRTKIVGIGAAPNFCNGMPFYIHTDVIPIEIKDRSCQPMTPEDSELVKTSAYEDPRGINLLVKFCEDENWLIQGIFDTIQGSVHLTLNL